MGATDLGKIAVIGSGSVGLFYGSKLAAQGADVRFLMRSGFDEADRRGIFIHSGEGGDVWLRRPTIFRNFVKLARVILSLWH